MGIIFVLNLALNISAAQIDTQRTQTTGVLFKVPSGARGAALGSACITSAAGAEAIIYNPACLVLGFEHELLADFGMLFEDIATLSLAYKYQTDYFAVGTFFSYLGYGAIDRYGLDIYNQPSQTNEVFSPYAWLGQVALASSLSPEFRLGLTTKLLREDLVDKAFLYIAWDLGVQVMTGLEGLMAGAAIKNIGQNFTDYALPIGIQIGAAYRFTLGFFQIDHLLVETAAELNRDQPLHASFGMEYEVLETLSIRCGYREKDIRIAGDPITGLNAGIGFKFREYTVDYSYTPDSVIGDAHRITFQTTFGKEIGSEKMLSNKENKSQGRYLYEFMK
jgi:hypothetical protein